MAFISGFFKSINGDRRYKADFFAEYFASFIADGIFPNPSTNMQVISIDNNMQVRVKAGKAWIKGYYASNTDDYILNVDIADGVLNRIDRVVLGLDHINREIRCYIKKGVFASNPVAPILNRNADCYELGIADIRINKGVIKINQADITDTRQNKELCGIVHGVIEQIDTTTIFNQYADKFNIQFEDFNKQLRAFADQFINSLNPQSDVAIQLQTQIIQNRGDISTINSDLNKVFYPAINKCKNPNGVLGFNGINAGNGWSISNNIFIHSGGSVGQAALMTDNIEVKEGDKVYFSCLAKAGDSNCFDIGIVFRDQTDTFINEKVTSIIQGTEFKIIKIEATIPSGIKYIRGLARVNANTVSNNSFEVTNINITLNKESPLNYGGTIEYLNNSLKSNPLNIIPLNPNNLIEAGSMQISKSYTGEVWLKIEGKFKNNLTQTAFVPATLPVGYRPQSFIIQNGMYLTDGGGSLGNSSVSISAGSGDISIHPLGTVPANTRKFYFITSFSTN